MSNETRNIPPRRPLEGKPWLRSLLVNSWVPLALALLVPVGVYVGSEEHVDTYAARIIILIGINITLAVSLQLINGVTGQFSLGHAGFMAVGAYLAGYATSVYGPLTLPDDEIVDFANPAAVLTYFVSLCVTLAVVAGALTGLVVLVRRSRKLHPVLPAVLFLGLLVWFIADVSAAFDAQQAKLLELQTGGGGGVEMTDEEMEAAVAKPPAYLVWSQLIYRTNALFTFLTDKGVAAMTPVSGWLPEGWRKPATFLAALVGGGAVAAIAGLVVGLPTLRLRGDYLAIATLGFAEIIRVAIVNAQSLGGATGLSVPVYPNEADPDTGLAAHYIFPWVYGVALLTTLIIWRLVHSPKGRALQAVREDEIAAAAIGVDPTHHKVTAFVIGAFFAGAAGALYAHFDGYLNANSFGLLRTIELVVMVTLGGLGNIWGAVIAAAVLTYLPEFLRMAPERFESLPANIGEWRMVIYSLLLIILMQLRTIGLWRRLHTAWADRRTARPGAPVVGGATS